MRRSLGGMAVVFGVFLLVIGVLAKPVLYRSLAIVKLDQRSTSESIGQNMTALYAHEVDGAAVFDRLDGVTLRSIREVVGIPGRVPRADRDDNAFWQTAVTSQALIDGEWVDLSYSDEGVSIDRHSGEATNCCGDYKSTGDLEDTTSVRDITREGLFFKFPFDVQQRTYPWWDGDLNATQPMQFLREEDVDGVGTYVFQQVTPSQEVQQFDKQGNPTTREVPRALFGDTTEGNVPVKVLYANTRTLWVEPNTGVLIKGQEELDRGLQADGYPVLSTTKGTIGYSDATVRANVEEWGSKGTVLGLLNGPLTPIGLVAGLLLLALGLLLLFRQDVDLDTHSSRARH